MSNELRLEYISEYIEDIDRTLDLPLPWEKLKEKNLIITGASGMMGSFIVDIIMKLNQTRDLGCHITAIGRSIDSAKERFSAYWESEHFTFISHNVKDMYQKDELGNPDFILHLASNTHPVAYAKDPIGTITTNILGLYNLLEYASLYSSSRVLLASSNEIYGENRGDVELFDENYCGYINSNTLRAGYPESKRCAEAMCQAYISQNNLDVVIARLTRSYGPTMKMSDTKAISQFIKNALNKQDIVLKSEGYQFYSYTYVSDAISGLLTILLQGETGVAYNIADEASDITLRDLAALIAGYSGNKVVFELPDEIEKRGYSTATKARLDGSKLKELGWKPYYNIETGMYHSLDIISKFTN